MAILALLWGSGVKPAQAVSMYQYTFGQSVYQVQPGETFTVPVYLTETVLGGTTSVLMTEGIGNAGIRLSYELTTTATQPATVVGVTPAPGFTNEGRDYSYWYIPSEVIAEGPGAPNPAAGLTVSSWSEINAQPVSGSPGQYSMLLGTFTFAAGNIVGETTTIKASDLFTDRIDTNTFESLIPLDGDIWTSTMQITVVPEPAGWIALLSMGLVAGGYWRWKRRPPDRG